MHCSQYDGSIVPILGAVDVADVGAEDIWLPPSLAGDLQVEVTLEALCGYGYSVGSPNFDEEVDGDVGTLI